MAVRRPAIAPRGAMSSPHMDSGRFLYNDGHATRCWAAVMRTQGDGPVDGWAATGLDATSRMRQESHESPWN